MIPPAFEFDHLRTIHATGVLADGTNALLVVTWVHSPTRVAQLVINERFVARQESIEIERRHMTFGPDVLAETEQAWLQELIARFPPSDPLAEGRRVVMVGLHDADRWIERLYDYEEPPDELAELDRLSPHWLSAD